MRTVGWLSADDVVSAAAGWCTAGAPPNQTMTGSASANVSMPDAGWIQVLSTSPPRGHDQECQDDEADDVGSYRKRCGTTQHEGSVHQLGV